MRRGGWSYEVTARCSRAEAMDLVADLSRQAELHPLIIGVVDLPPAAGAVRSYAITDRLLGGLRITYAADVLSITDDEVRTVARQRPRTTVHNRTVVTEVDGVCTIAVTVELEAPTLLFPIALREGRKAHLALADRLAEALRVAP